MESGAQQHTAPWQLKGEHAASFYACLGVSSQQHTPCLCPDTVPVPSYCCGCGLSFLHERQEVCHVAFFLRLSLLRGWEELSEQTFWLRPPAKHSTRVERARAPLPKVHTDVLSHTFSEAVSALSSRSLKMVQIDEYPWLKRCFRACAFSPSLNLTWKWGICNIQKNHLSLASQFGVAHFVRHSSSELLAHSLPVYEVAV